MNKPRHGRAPGPAPTRISGPGKVRIIGGQWRGTRLDVADSPGLRPTSDRVRETLFNWLAPMLPGARVLDLFAGSGALGLEAVSRGAGSAVLVERDAMLAGGLRALASKLQAGEAVRVIHADAAAWLDSLPDVGFDKAGPCQAGPDTAGLNQAGLDQGGLDQAGFDLVFLDPPFAADLWSSVLPRLLPKLAADAWLYIESPPQAAPDLPAGWALHREGATRDVRYALYRRRAAGVQPPAPAATLGTDPAGQRARPLEPTSE